MSGKNRVAFFIKGGGKYGYGHAFRCRELIGVLEIFPFVFSKEKEIIDFFGDLGINAYYYEDFREINLELKEKEIKNIIFDNHGPEKEECKFLKTFNCVSFECLANNYDNCSILIDSQKAPDGNEMHLYGLDYVIIRKDFFPYRRNETSQKIKKIAIIGGGSKNGVSSVERIKEIFSRSSLHILNKNSFKSYADFISSADIAITSGGVSMYELAFLGIPFIAYPVVKHQKDNIKRFIKNGGKCVYMEDINDVKNAFEKLRKEDLEEYLNINQSIIDGAGLERILKVIKPYFGIN